MQLKTRLYGIAFRTARSAVMRERAHNDHEKEMYRATEGREWVPSVGAGGHGPAALRRAPESPDDRGR